MKIRSSFVANSSSSSFIINKLDLTESQIHKIENHMEYAPKYDMHPESYDQWYVEDLEETIKVSTHMDNFDMREFLTLIGVPDKNIRWKDY